MARAPRILYASQPLLTWPTSASTAVVIEVNGDGNVELYIDVLPINNMDYLVVGTIDLLNLFQLIVMPKTTIGNGCPRSTTQVASGR